MKTIFKKGVAIILAVLMAMSIPVFAYADSPYDFTVESTAARHYQGVQYMFKATITNIPSDCLIEKTSTNQSAFTWDATNGATVVSSNNYSATENEDGTWTVTEDSTVTMPAPDTNIDKVTVSASYNNPAVGSADSEEISLLKPITSISATSDKSTDVDAERAKDGLQPIRSNPGCNYYYISSSGSGADSFYIDTAFDDEGKAITQSALKKLATEVKSGEGTGEGVFGFINYTPNPKDSNDSVVVSITGTKDDYNFVTATPDDRIAIANLSHTATNDCFTIKFSPTSGYRVEKNVNVYVCFAATGFKLQSNGRNIGSVDSENNGSLSGGTSTYTNQELTISPTDISPANCNDSFGYLLYNNDGSTLCDSSWYTVTDDGKCKLNIKNAGTYFLKAYTISKGRCLYRDLSTVISITVNEISNIANIGVYEKKADGTLDETKQLNTLTINRSGDSSDVSKYEISQNILFTDKDGKQPSGDYLDYTSSDETVASISSSGVITALKAGKTTITIASHNSPAVNKTVNVEVKQLADKIALSSPTKVVELPQGHTIPLKATLEPFDADEDISWSSLSGAITVDEKGNITAVEDYNLSGGSQDVTIRATTAESKKTATITIRVIPSKKATKVDIDANTTSDKYEGFYQDKYTYGMDSFTLKGSGYDENDNDSTDVLTWRVRYQIYDDLVDFSSTRYAGTYYNYNYDTKNDMYTVTPMITGTYTFYCIAVERGHENDEFTISDLKDYVYSTFEIEVVDKVINIKGSDIVLPTNSTGDIKLSISKDDRYDPIEFKSDTPDVADVSYNAETRVVTIIAKQSPTANGEYLPIIHGVSRSGASITLKVKISNDINDSTVDFVDGDEYTYTSLAIKPEINISFGEKQLELNRDYTLSYSDNVKAGTASIIITGKGDFVNSSKIVNFTINPKTIDLKENADDTIFNTTASVLKNYYQITDDVAAPLPTLSVADTEINKTLTVNSDYVITAKNNLRYGKATATVEGIGNYTGSFDIDYNVCDNLAANYVSIDEIPAKTYTGNKIEPEITVNYYGEVLDSNCYSVKYTNNTNKGTATVTITGIAPYFHSSQSTTFEIVDRSIADTSYITWVDTKVSYQLTDSNKAPVPALTIKDTERNTTLKLGVDYTVKGYNNTEAGDATAIITGIGNYGGSFEIQYKICDYISNVDFESIEDITFTGSALTPDINGIYHNSRVLVKDEDFSVKYQNNISVGTATVIVTGLSPYFSGTQTLNFNITPKEISEENVSVLVKANAYNITNTVSAPVPTLTVTDNDTKANLTLSNEEKANGNYYILTCENNTKAGIATATITGTGNYTGSITTVYNVCDSFAITKHLEIVTAPTQAYTGEPIIPDVAVYYDGNILEEGNDYNIKLGDNIYRGKATITVEGLAPYYRDNIYKYFEIVPYVVESENPTNSVEISSNGSSIFNMNGQDVSFALSSFDLNAIGYDSNGYTTGNTYKWYFRCNNGDYQELNIPTLGKNNISGNNNYSYGGVTYFSYKYNNNSETWTISPANSTEARNFAFKCEATDQYGNVVESEKTIVVAPSEAKFTITSNDSVVPTGQITEATVNFAYADSYKYNDVVFTCDKDGIVNIAKADDYLTSHKLIITALDTVSEVTITVTTRDGKSSSFKVAVANDMSNAVVSGIDNEYIYTGKAIEPVPTVSLNGQELIYNEDYTYSYSSNTTSVGTVTMTITGISAFYSGEKVVTYNITPKDIASADISVTDKNASYTVSPAVPDPDVKLTIKDNTRSRELVKGNDYTLVCTNNTAAGTATATITGVGSYTGTRTITYTIVEGSSTTPGTTPGSGTGTDSGSNAGTNNTPAQNTNPTPGTNTNTTPTPNATTTPSTGATNTTNTVATTLMFEGVTYVLDADGDYVSTGAKKVKISKLSKAKASFKANWKKVNGVKGYQIQYSTSKKFTKKTSKKVLVSGAKKTSTTVKKLKSKTNYYVRIRTYKTVNGKKVFSSWSAIKTVKTK